MDAARRIIESTRGDVVSEVRRLMLETALKDFEQRLLGKPQRSDGSEPES